MLDSQRDKVRELGVQRLALFGSVARNEATDDSEVDVLVDLADEKLTLEGYLDLCFFLEDLFGRHVDVVTFRSLKSHRRDRILPNAVYLESLEKESTPHSRA